MPPKRKPRQPAAQQAAITVTTLTRKPKGQTRSKQQPRPRRSRTKGSSLPWFLLGEFAVTADTPPGPLETLLLHPTEFPETPYATACSHHTHRTEHWWEFQTQVTTAANTGLRAALVLLPDPRLDPNSLTSTLAWSAVLAKQGAMMTSTGQGVTTSKLHAPPTTSLLSNAAPPQGVGSWVGFAMGSVCIYLLDAPIGLTSNSKVTITVLARPHLTVHYPLTGFVAWTTSHIQPTPQGVGWTMVITNPETDQIALNSHTASASLAGGCYWHLQNDRPTVWHGPLWCFAIYTCDHQGVDWQDNDSQSHEPHFYVVWREPGSTTTQVIGFSQFRDARNQVDGYYTQVPHAAELCISYQNATVLYNQRWAGITAGSPVTFTLVYKHPSAYQIWTEGTGTNTRPRTVDPNLMASRRPPTQRPPGTAPQWPLPPTEPAPIGGTGASLSSPLATTVTGLAGLVRGLAQQLTHLTQELQELKASSLPPTPHWRQSSQSLGTPVDPTPLSSGISLQSVASAPPDVPSWSTTHNPTHSISSRFGLRSPPRPRPSSALPASLTPWSPFLDQADATTPPATGCRRLPSGWELPACPGCTNPECDDCFEDAEEETVVSLPSSIGSVESLVDALTRLGGTDV